MYSMYSINSCSLCTLCTLCTPCTLCTICIHVLCVLYVLYVLYVFMYSMYSMYCRLAWEEPVICPAYQICQSGKYLYHIFKCFFNIFHHCVRFFKKLGTKKVYFFRLLTMSELEMLSHNSH